MEQPSLENIKAAYEAADENGKKMLRALYPAVFIQSQKRAESNRPVTERVKTFDDACHELGETHPFVRAYNGYAKNISEENKNDRDVLAFLQLRIIAAALNEGWEPTFANEEYRWYPRFVIYTKDELARMGEEKRRRVVGRSGNSAYADCGLVVARASYFSTNSRKNSGSRLAFKSEELAIYAGHQFCELWASFLIG